MDELNFASVWQVCNKLFNKDIFEVYTIALNVGNVINDRRLNIDGKHLKSFINEARRCQMILQTKISLTVYDEEGNVKERHVFE